MRKSEKILVLVTGLVALALILNMVGNRQVSAAPKATQVIDLDNPGRHPFQASAACTMNPGDLFCYNNFTVPANQLLVIETMSAFITVPPGQKAYADLNVTQQNGVGFFMPSTFVGNDGTNDRYATMQSLRAYAFPGTTVTAIGSRFSTDGNGSAITTISGYLVDCGTGQGCPLP